MSVRNFICGMVGAVLACAATELLASPDSDEPFGLVKTVSPEGRVTTEWRKLMANVEAARRELERCRKEPDRCDAGDREFEAIVNDAKTRQGREKIAHVNRRINGNIRYTSDNVQWDAVDAWSLPIDAENKGSLQKGMGDCEDYALAKYAALHQAGVPDADLRIVLVRDTTTQLDHAVLAVRDDNKWLILDNRWNTLVEDKELKRFQPLFVVERSGVKLLSKMFR